MASVEAISGYTYPRHNKDHTILNTQFCWRTFRLRSLPSLAAL